MTLCLIKGQKPAIHVLYSLKILLSFTISRILLLTMSQGTETTSPEPESTPGDGLPPEDLPTGPSLGQILGLVALVITILYIIGISWKVMKIFKGEYVPTEPVYLKYK